MLGLIFTYILTYGGALASLLNPYIGLLIYICFSIIRPESMWYWSVEPGNYSRIVAIALLVGWILRNLGDWNLGKAWWVTISLFAFWGWSIFSALFASNQEVAWGFVESLTKIVLPFLVGITIIRSMEQIKQLAWVIVASQGYVAYELNLSYYRDGFNRVHELGFGFMDNNCVAISMVTCVGMAFFLGLATYSGWLRMLALTSSILMIHTVFLAFSRGGMLALAVSAITAFVLLVRKPKYYIYLVIALILSFRLAGPEVQERFYTIFVDSKERDKSAESRLIMWAVCLDIMMREPIVGLGPNHFPIRAVDFGLTPGKEAHTLWLQIGAELGFPGLSFLLLFYLIPICLLWPLLRRPPNLPNPWLPDSAAMVISSLVGFIVAAQFVSLEGLEVPYYTTLVGAASLKYWSTAVPVLPAIPKVASLMPEVMSHSR